MRHSLMFGSLLLVIAVVGCAGAPLRMGETSADIRAAENEGAKYVPDAAIHLNLAKDELAQAARLAEQGKKPEAKSTLSRAEADAELAMVLAREDAQKVEAVEAVERVYQLRLANPERGTP